MAQHVSQCFEFSNCHEVAQVAFQAAVAPCAVKVHPCLCVSRATKDFLLYHLRKKGRCPFDFHISLHGVFLLPLSPSYTPETELLV